MGNYPVITRHPLPTAENITTDTSSFSINLSSADTDIQKALDTLDNLNILKPPIVTKTSDYTATYTDRTILIDSTSNDVTITLPTASGNTAVYILKNINNTNTITIETNGSEEIDGSTDGFILAYLHEVIRIQSDGTNWWIT